MNRNVWLSLAVLFILLEIIAGVLYFKSTHKDFSGFFTSQKFDGILVGKTFVGRYFSLGERRKDQAGFSMTICDDKSCSDRKICLVRNDGGNDSYRKLKIISQQKIENQNLKAFVTSSLFYDNDNCYDFEVLDEVKVDGQKVSEACSRAYESSKGAIETDLRKSECPKSLKIADFNFYESNSEIQKNYSSLKIDALSGKILFSTFTGVSCDAEYMTNNLTARCRLNSNYSLDSFSVGSLQERGGEL